ncbi:hypothetical protein HanRHA438_Chr09g0377581 [Helianthus annuus]|nr:hypothetical protein HanRHA438_Chr09g0377581 [Helianthus annuus]
MTLVTLAKMLLCKYFILQMLYLLKMALSHGSPFTRLVFHSVTPILDLVRPVQCTTFDKCDVMKKQASTSLKMLLLDVILIYRVISVLDTSLICYKRHLYYSRAWLEI